MLKTGFTELLDLAYPIVSAPMVAQSGGDLAGAVSKAGGLGTFGAIGPKAGSVPLDYLTENIAKVRAATDRPFGIGFITPFIEKNRRSFDFVMDSDVPVVLLSFADPTPYLPAIKSSGKLALVQVQTMDMARAAVGEGADAVAVQGVNAGGHCGERELLPFLAETREAFPDAVILAAGGVGDGRTLADMLTAGADGVWIGTGFRAVAECAETSQSERRAILESDGTDTIRSRVYDMVNRHALGAEAWPENIAMRTQKNALTNDWAGREEEFALKIKVAPERYADIWNDPESSAYGHLFSEAAATITRVESAKAYMARIVGEAEEYLSGRSGAF